MKLGTLNTYSLIKISGSDAITFLQGQLTNDVSNLDTHWQFAGYCNPKGRLLALFKIWKTNSDEFYALLSKDLTDSTVKRLKMYVMRSDVDIQVIDKTISVYSSIKELQSHNQIDSAENIKLDPFDVFALDNNNYILNISNRFLMVGDQTNIIDSSDSQWHINNIEDGLPNINNSTTELFIPQMVNLDLLNGISFKKGCYTGQEIVARMHYLGKLKKRMFVCRLEGSPNVAQPGDKIFNDINSEKMMGHIVNSQKQSEIVLAVLKLDNINNDLYLNEDIKISIIDPQPYTIPV